MSPNKVYTVYLGGQVDAMTDCLLYLLLDFHFIQFTGRFHPLLVHLPIGLILFSFTVSLLGEKQRVSMEKAWTLSSYLIAFFSILSVITGFCISQNGDYDSALIAKHQWTAISSTVISISILAIKSQKRYLTWLNMLLVVIAGHFGGTLTHGELFGGEETHVLDTISSVSTVSNIRATDSTSMITSTQHFLIYDHNIKPILQEKCYSCHSNLKKKGGLRLDTKEFIIKGGRKGTILKSGHPEASKLYKYLVLSTADEMHMPPRGKKQLNQSEILLIKNWIQEGAVFETSRTNNQVEVEVEVESKVLTAEIEETPITVPIKLISAEVPEANPIILEQLGRKGISISKSPYAANGWSVSFVNIPKITKEELENLMAIAPSLVELDLSNHDLKDADMMNAIKPLKNLRVLKLGNTGLNEQLLDEIGSFHQLEVLNIFGNPVRDEFAEELLKCKQLKRVYIWNTAMSSTTISKLAQTMKSTRFIGNNLQLIKQDSNTNKK